MSGKNTLKEGLKKTLLYIGTCLVAIIEIMTIHFLNMEGLNSK